MKIKLKAKPDPVLELLEHFRGAIRSFSLDMRSETSDVHTRMFKAGQFSAHCHRRINELEALLKRKKK